MRAKTRSALKAPKALLVRIVEGVQSIPLYRRLAHAAKPEVDIHEASAEEHAIAQRWYNPDSPPPMSREDPNVTHFVAMHGRRLVGFVQLVRRTEEAGGHSGHWLYSLRVRLRYRGMGIGESLCQQVIGRAMAEGAPELLLLVREHNRSAIRLYTKMGFVPKVVPPLEPQLENERLFFGRRSIVMSKRLERGVD